MKNYLLTTILLISLAAVLGVGCRGNKDLVYVETRDTVIMEVREVLRDTMVRIPPSKALAKARVALDSLGRVQLRQLRIEQGQRANIKIEMSEAGEIEAECECDSTAIYLHWKERHEREVIKTDKETSMVVPPSKWDVFWSMLGKVLSGGLVLFLGIKFILK